MGQGRTLVGTIYAQTYIKKTRPLAASISLTQKRYIIDLLAAPFLPIFFSPPHIFSLPPTMGLPLLLVNPKNEIFLYCPYVQPNAHITSRRAIRIKPIVLSSVHLLYSSRYEHFGATAKIAIVVHAFSAENSRRKY